MELLNLEVLNAYKPVILVGMSVIYAIATLFLWYLTHRSNRLAREALEEMKAAHQQEMRPYLGLHPEINAQGWFLLTLQNYGRTAAFHTQLTFTKDYVARKERNGKQEFFRELGICREITFLGPQAELTEVINLKAPQFWELNKGQRVLKGILTYKDNQGKTYREEIVYDLNPLFNRKNLIFPSLQETLPRLERTCQKLTQDLDQLSR